MKPSVGDQSTYSATAISTAPTDFQPPLGESVSDGVEGDQGWPLYLACYAALFDGGS